MHYSFTLAGPNRRHPSHFPSDTGLRAHPPQWDTSSRDDNHWGWYGWQLGRGGGRRGGWSWRGGGRIASKFILDLLIHAGPFFFFFSFFVTAWCWKLFDWECFQGFSLSSCRGVPFVLYFSIPLPLFSCVISNSLLVMVDHSGSKSCSCILMQRYLYLVFCYQASFIQVCVDKNILLRTQAWKCRIAS